MYFTLSSSQVRILSALFTDLAAGWILALFVTTGIAALSMNVFFAILSLNLAIKLDEQLWLI